MRSILIVDNSSAVRQVLKNLFEDNGWYVIGEAEDGKQAVEMTLERKPDIVLMDICMPQQTGFEAVDELAESAPQVPVIIFTGVVPEQLANTMHRPNVCGVLSKDLDAELLVPTVERRYAERKTA